MAVQNSASDRGEWADAPPESRAIPFEDDALPKGWVCVRHRANLGQRAYWSLRGAGIKTHWPRQEIDQGRNKAPTIEPYFPGYLFANATDAHAWSIVSSDPFVIGILGAKLYGQPILMPDRIIHDLIDRAGGINGIMNDSPEARAARDRHRARHYQPGTELKLTTEALDGIKAILQRDDGKAFVDMLAQMFGRSVPMRVSRENVAPVG